MSGLIVCVLAGAAAGQSETRGDAKAKENCFRGRPLPQCHSFWITEFGLSRRFGQRPRLYSAGEATYYGTFELGWMVNRNERSAQRVIESMFGVAMRRQASCCFLTSAAKLKRLVALKFLPSAPALYAMCTNL